MAYRNPLEKSSNGSLCGALTRTFMGIALAFPNWSCMTSVIESMIVLEASSALDGFSRSIAN
jgi:hypothetical protein